MLRSLDTGTPRARGQSDGLKCNMDVTFGSSTRARTIQLVEILPQADTAFGHARADNPPIRLYFQDALRYDISMNITISLPDDFVNAIDIVSGGQGGRRSYILRRLSIKGMMTCHDEAMAELERTLAPKVAEDVDVHPELAPQHAKLTKMQRAEIKAKADALGEAAARYMKALTSMTEETLKR